MEFSKKDNIYRITRITGAHNNILGVVFDDKNRSNTSIEVIEWHYPDLYQSRFGASKEEVLKQVVSGLELVNKALGTNYKLSQIYFTPSDSSANLVYSLLICKLIRYYHAGNEFREI
jgi:hypothetical protein